MIVLRPSAVDKNKKKTSQKNKKQKQKQNKKKERKIRSKRMHHISELLRAIGSSGFTLFIQNCFLFLPINTLAMR